MEKLTMMITNFASGELSPTLNGRVDLQQYYSGASHIENYTVVPTGGIQRRVGFKRIIEIGQNSRIIPFILNKNRSFIFEFFETTLKIWEVQIDGSLNLFQPTVVTPYTSLAQIKQLQYAQNYDTLVITHKEYRPYIIKWNSNGVTNSFSISQMEFDFTPDVLIDDDFDFIMVCGKNATTTPIVTATASGDYSCTWIDETGTSRTKLYSSSYKLYCVFDAKLKYYDTTQWVAEWKDVNDSTNWNTPFTTAGNYPGCCAFFNNRLFLAGTQLKPQKIWASAAPDTDDVRYNDFCTWKQYVTVNKVVKMQIYIHLLAVSAVKMSHLYILY